MIVAVNIRQNYILEFQLEPEGHQYVFQDLGETTHFVILANELTQSSQLQSFEGFCIFFN